MKYTTCLLKRYGKGLFVYVAAAVGAAVMLGSTCSVLNKAPTVPVISGPSAGVVGVPVTFKATATDPESDSIAFQFDWGDSSTLAWTNLIASGETTSVLHTYSDSGTFSVKAKAKDQKDKEGGWSGGLSLEILAAGGGYPDSIYAEIATAAGGRAGAITPDGEYLYVAHGSDNRKVTPIRLADRTALSPISFSVDPYDIVSSVDGSHVFVTLPDSGQVAAIRTADNTVDFVASVGRSPRFLAGTPDGQFLLVTIMNRNIVLFLRTSDLSIADSTPAGERPQYLVADDVGDYAYVSSNGAAQIVDVGARMLTDSLTAILRPGHLGLSRDGRFLYVSSWDDTGFVVVRLSDRTVMERLDVGDQSIGAFASTANDKYLMFSYLRGVKYVDTRTYSVVDSLVLPGENRQALVMHPHADTLYLVGYKKVYLTGPRRQ
jgi:DNA-binding beta-propeller fold protein YncE